MRAKPVNPFLAAAVRLARGVLSKREFPAIRVLWVLAVLADISSCSNPLNSATKDLNANALATVATDTPVFSPASNTYTTAQELTITCGTPGATIYYTVDGSAPTERSAKYTGTISLSEDEHTYVIRAIARATGYMLSPIVKGEYVISSSPPDTPTGLAISVPTGDTGLTNLDLSWGEVGAATFYRVYRYSENSEETLDTYFDIDAPASSFRDDSVKPGTQYFYRIRSGRDGGILSYLSSSVSATTSGVPVTSVSITRGTHVPGSATVAMNSTVLPATASIPALVWSSSNTSVATVDSASGIVTRVAAGTVTITATATDNSGFYDTCSLSLYDASLAFNANGGTRSSTSTISGIPSNITGYFSGDTWTWTSPAGDLPQMLDPTAAAAFGAPAGSSLALFKCWNAKADGSGTNYYIGGTALTLAAGTNTIYAQWLGNSMNAADYLLINPHYRTGNDYGWSYPDAYIAGIFNNGGDLWYRLCGWTDYYSTAYQDVDLVAAGLDPEALKRTTFSVQYQVNVAQPYADGGGAVAISMAFLNASGTAIAVSSTGEQFLNPLNAWTRFWYSANLAGSSSLPVRSLEVANAGRHGAWLGPNFIFVILK